MEFRKIRPSFGDSTASTSNPSHSTSESTGSDPRHVRGAKDAESSTASSKRRRVPLSVTRNACLNCKKARAKCDGKQPCKRCASRLEIPECVYEIHIKHAKEELVKQIKELKAKDLLTEQIFQALSADEKVPEILDRLRHGTTYESIVEWLGRYPVDDFETLSPKDSQNSTLETTDHEMEGANSTTFQWTSVTSDTAVLDHLFRLYFAWVHPVHTLFSEAHFLESYKQMSENYCSAVLVNAICTMACQLHSVTDADDVDFEQLGMEFSHAARANMDSGVKSVTTIQALAVMFLVDTALANGLRASSYLKVAINNISNVDYMSTKGFTEVLKNTVLGVRNLSVEWAQMTCQVPTKIRFDPLDDVENGYDEDLDEQLDDVKWYFYRYVNDQCPAWPSLLTTTNREKSKLIEIIHDVCTMMYAQHATRVSAHHVLQQYGRFMSWREDLPSILGNVESNNGQALPHVLSLLILYANSVIQLLRPLLDFEGFPTALVEEVILNHAQEGLSLLDDHYRTQYTCRYQPVLQMLSLLHLTDLIVRFFPDSADAGFKNGVEATQFGLEVLSQSHTGYLIAGPLQEMLRKTAQECSIPLSHLDYDLKTTSMAPKAVYTMDDMIDACTRPTYVQPVDEIHSRYLPSFSEDWIAYGPSFGFQEPASSFRRLGALTAEERGAQSLMQIRNLLNKN